MQKPGVADSQPKTGELTGEWHETSAGILYVVSGSVQFDDDFAHWHNGFCRLLEIPEEKARLLIETAVESALDSHGKLLNTLAPETRVAALKQAVQSVFNLPEPAQLSHTPAEWGSTFDGKPADHIYAGSISGNKERKVVGNLQSEFGWQINAETNQPVDAASVIYDRSYFDTPRHPHCGMRDYIRHDDWRLEKARRLMRTALKGAGARARKWLRSPAAVQALDVGSAVGYFRQAMAELGFRHYGIDLSREAIGVAKERFGFDTWQGTLFDLPAVADKHRGKFNIITLWDTIEHLDYPRAVVRLLEEFLAPDGLLVIRTPSLTAFETEILGDMYYSFKLDHIRYFSPKSLNELMHMAGFKPLYMETTSHLFRGVLGADYLFQMGEQLRGADIVALYERA